MTIAENFIQVIYWLNKLKLSFNVRIVHNDWSEKLDTPMFITNIQIDYKGKELETTGINSDKKLSYIIAAVELIERILFVENSLPSTSGLALHFDKEAAFELSREELIERDTYMYHYISQNKLSELSGEEVDLYQKLKRAYPSLKLCLFELENSYGIKVVQAIAIGKNFSEPFGMIVGLGSSKKLSLAIEKSLREVLITLGHNLLKPISLENFVTYEEQGKLKIYHHHQLALSSSYYEAYKKVFLEGEREASFKNSFISDIETVELFIPQELGLNFKLFAFYSSSESMQQIFWGRTTLAKINKSRFSETFLQRIESLGHLPHPFA